MTARSARIVGQHDRTDVLLSRVAIGCLILLPPVMAVAHRSAPLVISLAALFVLGSVWAGGRIADLGRGLANVSGSRLGAAIVAFLAWSAVSIAWSRSGPLALQALGEFVLPIMAALVLALTLPARMGRTSSVLFAVAVMIAAAIVLADLATGLALRRAFGMRADPFVLNRPVLTLLVLLPTAIWLLVLDRRLWLAAALLALVGAAILRSESGAAKLGLLAMLAIGGLTLASRKAGLALVAVALLASLALAPVAGELANRTLPDLLYSALARAHAQDRVDIWRSFGTALRERPILGVGFGGTARLGDAPVAGRVAPDFATLLAVGHPHNAPLQIWVELGAIGAFLAALVAALLLRAMMAFGRTEMSVSTSLVAAALADSLVGQGAWQGWWPAAIGASLVWFNYGRSRPIGVTHGSG